jgi:membrane protein DedA with SNARE-associated domain
MQPDSKIAVTYSRGAGRIVGVARAVINPVFVGFSYISILEWFTVFTALGYVAFFSYNTLRTAASS